MSTFTANSDTLHHSGQRCNTMHLDTHEVMSSACSGIADAIDAGWVGASAESMRARLEAIRAAGGHITDRLGHHSSNFHASAAGYARTETATSQSLDESRSRLNLSTE